MNVEFLERFGKDLDRISSKSTKQSVAKIIAQVEAAQKLSDIAQLKKLQGHKSAYRIRIGDYRIGFFFEKDLVLFARVVHRKDIYQVFP